MKILALSFLVCGLVGCASSDGSYSSSPTFSWPVRKGKLTQAFKYKGHRHDGVDISGPKGTPIYAAAAGTVIYAGQDFSGYGNLIIIEHGSEKWATFYAHLDGFKVRQGQRVSKGLPIGLMGRTGRATGVHLHFEVRYNLKPIDPMPLINQTSLATLR